MSADASSPTTRVSTARAAEWADPTPAEIESLLAHTERANWRDALARIESQYPFFAKRMRSLGLGNWHALLLLDPRGSALDIGCGFGSLALGLGDYYRFAVGVDALRERVRYGALRATQDRKHGNAFVQGTGLTLPFRGASFDLVTLNGVLEWAGFHARGHPGELQRSMAVEARRVLKPDGVLAIAIENRFAMETLMGMPDTHTGVRLLPALPRILAGMIMQLRKRAPFRTFLYSRAGYERLIRSAGFAQVQVLDLVSSYNDYDFVVTPGDAATYQLLWSRKLVRTFYNRAGSARRLAARATPRLLGETSYAYLVLAGASVQTVLDARHSLWAEARSRGVDDGVYRFGCNGARTGTMVLVTHDGNRITGLLALNGGSSPVPGSDIAACLPPHLGNSIVANAIPGATWTTNGVAVRSFSVGRENP